MSKNAKSVLGDYVDHVNMLHVHLLQKLILFPFRVLYR